MLKTIANLLSTVINYFGAQWKKNRDIRQFGTFIFFMTISDIMESFLQNLLCAQIKNYKSL